jgi:iron complex outermembrane receptor protein
VPAETDSEQDFFADIPVVLSATRLRQPIKDAPVTVTVIDREMIEASGFTEIPDLMRLVPGFVVDYDSGHIPVTGYHLLHDRYVRHQQVLIDGRSVYTPILGGVPWTDLPITMDDIERIEVVRGPNAASYGSNSFLGVINIITRHAALDRGTSVKVNSGDNGLNEGFMRYGNNLGKMDYVVSLAYRQDWGFEERHDDKRVRLGTFRGDYQVDNHNSLIFQLGYNEGPREEDNTIDLAVPDHQRYVTSQYQQIRWIRALPDYGELRLQFNHSALDEAKSYPGLDQGFLTERYELELQHTFNLGEAARIVWGGSQRRDKSLSDYYVVPEAPEYITINRLFGNLEYKYTPDLIFNGGLMIEDNDLDGVDYLPRAGVNYHLTPLDTVRFSISRANREPVLTEEYPDLPGLFPIPLSWQNDLQPEYITAYELGYLTETRDRSIVADVKIYQEDITGLISYGLAPSGTYVLFDNFDDITISGIEAQFTIRPSSRSRIHVAFAHTNINADNVTGLTEYDLAAPENSLSLLGIWHFDNGMDGSLGYYYKTDHRQLAHATGDPVEYKPYKRIDFRLAKKFKTAATDQQLALVVQNAFDETQDSRLKNFPGRRFYVSYKLQLD